MTTGAPLSRKISDGIRDFPIISRIRKFLLHPLLPFLFYPFFALGNLIYGGFNLLTEREYEHSLEWLEPVLAYGCRAGLLLGAAGIAAQWWRGHRGMAALQGFFFGLFVLGTLLLGMLAELI